MTEGVWYLDPEAGAVEAEDEETYDEAFGPGDGHAHAGHDSAEAAAVHERDEATVERQDREDLDEVAPQYDEAPQY